MNQHESLKLLFFRIFLRLFGSVLMLFLLMGMNPAAMGSVPTELNDVLDVYRKSDSIILEVRKTLKNTVLDKENISKGMIRFVKGKFYWETTEPEKNLVIYDGKTLWTVQYPPAEFKDMTLQVAKMGIKNKKNSPIILTEIFGTRPLDSVFKVKTGSKNGALINFELSEIKSEFGVKNLILKIDTNEKRVVSLEYLDEVDNETKVEFRSTQFNVKVRAALFNYKPPKNAKVTEYQK